MPLQGFKPQSIIKTDDVRIRYRTFDGNRRPQGWTGHTLCAAINKRHERAPYLLNKLRYIARSHSIVGQERRHDLDSLLRKACIVHHKKPNPSDKSIRT